MSSRKRLRDEAQAPFPSSSTPLPEDSIAAFIALHSPPVKLVRTSPYGCIPPAPPPAPSRWSDLPVDLFTSVCHFLSSWRDLLRLARVHRHLHQHIMATHIAAPASPHEDTSQASCWAFVDTVKVTQRIDLLTINDRRIHLRAKSDKCLPSHSSSPSSSSSSTLSRFLPFDPSIVDLCFSIPPSPCPLTPTQLSTLHHSLSHLPHLTHRPRLLHHLLTSLHTSPLPRTPWRSPSSLFTEVSPLHLSLYSALRLIPSLRYLGDATHSASLLFSLPSFQHLRHLTLDFYAAPAPPDDRTLQALRRTTHHALSALQRTLITLTLLHDDLGLVQPTTLLTLHLTHLELCHSSHLTQLITPHLSSPTPMSPPYPLTQSLHSLCAYAGHGGEVHALPFYFPALHHLTSLIPMDVRTSHPPPPLTPLTQPSPLLSLSGSLDCLARPLHSEGWAQLRRSLTSLTLQVRGSLRGLAEVLKGLSSLTQLSLLSGRRVTGGLGMAGGGEGGEGEWLPSQWLPAQPRLTHLVLHCPALITDAFLLDLFQLPVQPPSPSPNPLSSSSSTSSSSSSPVTSSPSQLVDDDFPSLIDDLQSFGLLLSLDRVSEAVVRRWRRARCAQLRRVCVQFDDAWMADEERERVRDLNDSLALAFAPGACSRTDIDREAAHVAFLLHLGLPG